jgi:hypothetical protein
MPLRASHAPAGRRATRVLPQRSRGQQPPAAPKSSQAPKVLAAGVAVVGVYTPLMGYCFHVGYLSRFQVDVSAVSPSYESLILGGVGVYTAFVAQALNAAAANPWGLALLGTMGAFLYRSRDAIYDLVADAKHILTQSPSPLRPFATMTAGVGLSFLAPLVLGASIVAALPLASAYRYGQEEGHDQMRSFRMGCDLSRAPCSEIWESGVVITRGQLLGDSAATWVVFEPSGVVRHIQRQGKELRVAVNSAP